jgi:hypothetical protein
VGHHSRIELSGIGLSGRGDGGKHETNRRKRDELRDAGSSDQAGSDQDNTSKWVGYIFKKNGPRGVQRPCGVVVWNRSGYSVYDSALGRMKNVEWQFHQEIATFRIDGDIDK